MRYQPPHLEVLVDRYFAVIRDGAGCKCALLCRDGNLGESSSAGAYAIDE